MIRLPDRKYPMQERVMTKRTRYTSQQRMDHINSRNKSHTNYCIHFQIIVDVLVLKIQRKSQTKSDIMWKQSFCRRNNVEISRYANTTSDHEPKVIAQENEIDQSCSHLRVQLVYLLDHLYQHQYGPLDERKFQWKQFMSNSNHRSEKCSLVLMINYFESWKHH